MPKKVDLQQVAKDLDQATKELSKEQDAKRKAVRELQRRHIQLQQVNNKLGEDNQTAQEKLDSLQLAIQTAERDKEQLVADITELERENTGIKENISNNSVELSDTIKLLEAKKASLDEDLDAYSTTRKQEIRDAILKANEELVNINLEMEQQKNELQSKQEQLAELNQVYLDEQEAIKVSSTDTEATLTENREKVLESQQKLEATEQELKELEYNRDSVLATITKAKEEHENYLEYERQSRKILDNKDRELQKREANMSQDAQFLKNRRSNLPAM